MIFRRDRKRRDETSAEADPVATPADEDAPAAAAGAAAGTEGPDPEAEPTDEDPASGSVDLEMLDLTEWRDEGPWDIEEVTDVEDDTDGPRIDLGSMIVTGVGGSELRLQVADETQQIISAMLVIESEAPAGTGSTQTVTSALELGAYAAPRSGGFWPELREEISEGATSAGGSASLAEGPFGVELFRLFPVTTPEGEEGYQPSKMWVAEGPRWLLRGIVYGQAAIEESDEAPAVLDVAAAFRRVVVRRGDEPMAPGDLLPLTMPDGAVRAEQG